MEVLGALASCIALAQGLNAGLRIVSFARDLPEIQRDFEALRREVLFIEHVLQVCQHVVDSCPNNGDSPLMIEAIQQLKEIQSELGEFVTDCSRVKKGKDGKAKKFKWILEGNKLEKLRTKARDARLNLQTALIYHQGMMMNCKQEKFNFQLELICGEMSTLNSRLTQPKHDRVEEPSDVAITEEDELTAETEEDTDEQLTPEPGQQALLPTTDPIKPHSRFPSEEAIAQLRESYYTRINQCPSRCPCRCHFRKSEYKTQPWLRPLLGSFSLSSNAAPGLRAIQCTDSRCKRGGGVALTVQHQFPTWLWAGVLAFRASHDVLGGFRYSSSLRPCRKLSRKDHAWFCIEGEVQILHEFLKNSVPYFPEDSDERGEGLVEYALAVNAYEALELLFRLWNSLLSEKGLPRRVAVMAYQKLDDADLGDWEVNLLHRALAWTNEEAESTTTMLHDAVVNGGSLGAALQEEPWSIGVLDHKGEAAMHAAAGLNSVVALNELISAGADVDVRDWAGHTPLMIAAWCNSRECVQRLLQAKCRVQLQDGHGSTALHWAVNHASADVVGMLMVAGASVSVRNSLGQSPVHFLAHSREGTQEKLCHLRTAADFDLEAKDNIGMTPVLLAIYTNHLLSLRCLVEAGTSLLAVNNSRNILHHAALYPDLEALHYLASLELSSINTEHLDVDGNSPWDLLQYTIYAPSWMLGNVGRPDPDKQEAFTHLYQDIRDRNLRVDIRTLQGILEALSQQNTQSARAKMAPLIRQKEEWKRLDLLETFRAIDGLIRVRDLDLASDALMDVIEEMEEEMDSSPWEKTSRHIPSWVQREKGLTVEELSDSEMSDRSTREDTEEFEIIGSDGDSVTSNAEDAA